MIERRRHARIPQRLPAKLQSLEDGRYLSGATCNTSAGGTLLHLARRPKLTTGQPVRVALAQHRRQVILTDDDFVPGHVVRCVSFDGGCSIAIRFDAPQLLAATA